MDISVREMNRVDLVVVDGRVDSTTAPRLGEVLSERIDKGARNLVVDLAGVEYLSSAGLRELVSALKRVKSHGGDVRIAAPSERVSEVLALAGLDAIFDVYGDQVSAVGSF